MLLRNPRLELYSSYAVFSDCDLYRWSLKKSFRKDVKSMLFIGLNPSIANGKYEDPTFKRLINLFTCLGYREILVLNIFARISKYSRLLSNCSDPIGKYNNQIICSNVLNWSQDSLWDLCLGWGQKGTLFQRNIEVLKLLRVHFLNRSVFCKCSMGPLAFGLTKEGHPRHPLYLRKDTVLTPFRW